MVPTPDENKGTSRTSNEFDDNEINNSQIFDNIPDFMSDIATALIHAAQDEDSSSEDEDDEIISETMQSEMDINDKIFSVNIWYTNFENLTVPTKIIKIPQQIVDWFLSKEIADLELTCCPYVDDFQSSVEQAIANLGGTVYIKNNWHAPTDAEMFSFNRLLKCNSFKNILYFMMVSTRISTDFEKNMGDNGFYLQIRSWMDIHPASEFRCIVVHKQLMGITSRDWPIYYKHFKTEGHKIIQEISDFYYQHIQAFPLDHFVFDVILTPGKRCILWDFSPLKDTTELYSFMWDEISNIMEKPAPVLQAKPAAVFRYLKEQPGLCVNKNTGYKLQIEN